MASENGELKGERVTGEDNNNESNEQVFAVNGVDLVDAGSESKRNSVAREPPQTAPKPTKRSKSTGTKLNTQCYL